MRSKSAWRRGECLPLHSRRRAGDLRDGPDFRSVRILHHLQFQFGRPRYFAAKHLNLPKSKKHVLAQVTTAFRPEFLGRIDSKLVFRKFAYEVQVEIARMNLDGNEIPAERGHEHRLCRRRVDLSSPGRIRQILGARPLNKADGEVYPRSAGPASNVHNAREHLRANCASISTKSGLVLKLNIF